MAWTDSKKPLLTSLYENVSYPYVGPYVESHKEGALDSERQCFHYISADLSNAAEATRVLVEITAWNGGLPPDVVWCVAGAAHPTLFADTPVDVLRQQMDTNYFSAAYIGHAALQVWVKQPSEHAKAPSTTSAATATPLPPRHLIFTSSVIAFYTFAGYAPYSPAKAALRGLGDVLANEVRLYDAGGAPPIRVHTVFPATIDSPGYSFENSVKSDLTKKLEEGDEGQTPEEVARACIAGLERGDEAVATPFFPAWIMMATQLGGTRRRGYGVVDMLLAWFMILVTPFVRWSHDKDVRNWGKDHGPSGMKRA